MKENIEFKIFGSKTVFVYLGNRQYIKKGDSKILNFDEVKHLVRSVWCPEVDRQIAKRKNRGEKLEWY